MLAHETNALFALFALKGFFFGPWNAFWFSVAFILLGWGLFWLGFRGNLITPTEADKAYIKEKYHAELSKDYPKFNPLVYSLETFVPLLKLEVSQYWLPNANAGTPVPVIGGRLFLPKTWGGGLRFYLWVHIIAGWLLTTLWVGGLAGLVKT